MLRKNKRQWFVEVKSNWVNDDWKIVDGPFDTLEEAEAAKRRYEYHPISPRGGIDLKWEIHARVVSKTQAGVTEENWPEVLLAMLDLQEHPAMPWNADDWDD